MSLGWGNANQLLLNKIRVLQNNALRNILFVDRLSTTKELYEKTHILPLIVIVQSQLVNIFHNHTHGKKILFANLIQNVLIHNHATRSHQNLKVPQVKSTFYGLKSPFYNSILLYNSLSNATKNLPINTFKNRVKLHFYQLYLGPCMFTFTSVFDQCLSLSIL